MFVLDSRVRYSEVDSNEVLSIPSLIDYFQDVAIFHSKDLGLGTVELKEEDKAWIVCAWQVEIKRLPKLGENIRVCTYPYEFNSLFGLRNCFIEDESGDRVVKCNSIWAIMNTETLRVDRVPKEIASVYPLEEKLEMDYKGRKIKLPDGEGTRLEEIQVTKSYIDSLGHVNNAKYVEMALGCVKNKEDIKTLRVEYIRQAHEGDTIYPVIWENDNTTCVALLNDKDECYASIECTF